MNDIKNSRQKVNKKITAEALQKRDSNAGNGRRRERGTEHEV